MRLEVTLSGEYYKICALKLTKKLAQRMRDEFGAQWRQVLNRLAVGPKHKEALSLVAEKTGQVPPVEYKCCGVLLSSPTLSLSLLAGGAVAHTEQLNQALRTIEPRKIMAEYQPEDVLGVFAMTGGGFLRCAFELAKNFDGSLLSLSCDDSAGLMNVKTGFELVHSMTYAEGDPVKVECLPAAQMEHLKQVFHAKRR